MPRYNFTSLSSQDFEELTRDLLQAEWEVALEAFKAGRDRGIDLRYSPGSGGKTIIQCKHYVGSGFAKLLGHLRDCERPKIEKLRPNRYVVVTSVALTPDNKDEIARTLHPFILNVKDIVGAADIEGLLSRHPAVERANFKLWLTSTEVIERVLHNAEVCQTEFEVERIRQKLPLFVQCSAFPRAMKLLDESRIVVISGIPGIGKTTLAEMLLYTHLEQGYEPVVIKAEIAEGKRFFKKEAKRIFYYDDFLGQIYLGDRHDYLGGNQDAALTDFMEMIQGSSHARLILTTREHILHAALRMSERLARNPMLQQRCILELTDYSYADKARILYNHLYFSKLPVSYKSSVLEEHYFLDIIKHENFNPRLIEWLSTALRQREVPVNHYREYISRLLESPIDIWDGAFRNQISHAARHLLLSFFTLGGSVNVADLEPAFRSLHCHSAAKYNKAIAPGDFRGALRELDGAFLSYKSGRASYLNPSIRDFIAWVISNGRDIAEDLLTSAARFKQVASLWELSVEHPGSELAAFFASNGDLLSHSLQRLLNSPSVRWQKSGSVSWGSPIDMTMEARVGFLIDLSEAQRSPQVFGLASQASDLLLGGWNHGAPDVVSVLRLLTKIKKSSWFLARRGRAIYRKLLEGMLNDLTLATASEWIDLVELPANAMDWTDADQSRLDSALEEYCENGVGHERRNCGDLDELQGLRESLIELGRKARYDFSYDIERLDEDIAEREEETEPLYEGSGVPSSATATLRDLVTDDNVRQMFSTLVSE
jgi:hypothetical protein